MQKNIVILIVGVSPDIARQVFIQAMGSGEHAIIYRSFERFDFEPELHLNTLASLRENFTQKINLAIQERDMLLSLEPVISTRPPQHSHAGGKHATVKPKASGSPHLYIARARSWL